MMRKISLIIALFTVIFCSNISGQETPTLDGKAYLTNGNLYTKEFKKKDFLIYGYSTVFIRTFKLHQETDKVIYTSTFCNYEIYLENNFINWTIEDSIITYLRGRVSPTIDYSGRGVSTSTFSISNKITENKDTAKFVRDYYERKNKFRERYSTVEERRKVLHKRDIKEDSISNSWWLPFIHNLFNYYHLLQEDWSTPPQQEGLSFDFMHQHDSTYWFFVREPEQITLWEFKRFSPGVTVYDKPEFFFREKTSRQIRTYCYNRGITYKDFHIPTKEEIRRNRARQDTAEVLEEAYHPEWLPKKKKYIHNAIRDTMFFEGHFKAVEQDGSIFFVNLSHGSIYYMGKKQIEKIGRVKLEQYKFPILGNYVFIEDRDKNRLIFFAPVVWEDKDLPRPKTKTITDPEVFKNKFETVVKQGATDIEN